MENQDGQKTDFFKCNNAGANLQVLDRPDAAQAKWIQLAKKD